MLWVVVVEIFLIGIALSMDAFAVSICNGMIYNDLNKRKIFSMPIVFGVFQAVMPTIGFFLGYLFIDYIEAFDHWVAFILLLFIGGKMIFDSVREMRKPPEEIELKKYSFGEVMVQGVATSIDALAVGVSMLAMDGITATTVWGYVAIIGVTTFCISLAGVFIGIKVGKLFKNKADVAQIIGGLVLIGIGLKILIEGLV